MHSKASYDTTLQMIYTEMIVQQDIIKIYNNYKYNIDSTYIVLVVLLFVPPITGLFSSFILILRRLFTPMGVLFLLILHFLLSFIDILI